MDGVSHSSVTRRAASEASLSQLVYFVAGSLRSQHFAS